MASVCSAYGAGETKVRLTIGEILSPAKLFSKGFLERKCSSDDTFRPWLSSERFRTPFAHAQVWNGTSDLPIWAKTLRTISQLSWKPGEALPLRPILPP